MSEIRDILKNIADRHDERMRNDPRYRQTYALMAEATKPTERSRPCDRDGYCDNPARGY
jgi:hypothetical protein